MQFLQVLQEHYPEDRRDLADGFHFFPMGLPQRQTPSRPLPDGSEVTIGSRAITTITHQAGVTDRLDKANERREDHHLIRQRIHKLPEIGNLPGFPRQHPVKMVGIRRYKRTTKGDQPMVRKPPVSKRRYKKNGTNSTRI